MTGWYNQNQLDGEEGKSAELAMEPICCRDLYDALKRIDEIG